jgi:hypothetical protein
MRRQETYYLSTHIVYRTLSFGGSALFCSRFRSSTTEGSQAWRLVLNENGRERKRKEEGWKKRWSGFLRVFRFSSQTDGAIFFL